jgi:uncharacterized protein (DUF1501 family)
MTNLPDRCCLWTPTCEEVSRRRFLGFSGTFAASLLVPSRPSLAGGHDPRFLFVILRGALDGLSAVMPVGDPDFARFRDGFVQDIVQAGTPLKLDATFSLNPALKTLASLYGQKQAVFVHAASTPYRERSHFDGQEVLESGLPKVTHGDSGWLNRALAAMPGTEAIGKTNRGLSIGPTIPLVMRGTAPVTSWSPQHLQEPTDDTVLRVLSLYDARDPQLAGALRKSLDLDAGTKMASGAPDMAAITVHSRNAETKPAPVRGVDAVMQMADGAARLLARPDGPRIGALSIDGWDTHADEKPGTGRLGRLLGVLDQLFDRLHQGLAPVWNETVIVAATEFGRTVRINGTAGTDHGTATAAFVLGGAVKGGRIIADWPGLADNNLYEGRDLKATTDLRSVLMSVLADHLGLERGRLINTVFPGSEGVAPVRDLVA